MNEYKKIVTLRNGGMTQEGIAAFLGISRRTVIRYLNNGDVPHYQRSKSTKPDPLDGMLDLLTSTLEKNPNLTLVELFDFAKEHGYKGSLRTLRRKTRIFREKLKRKNVYFEREKIPGEVMEGDFTQLHVDIGGICRTIHLWVTTLTYSNTIFATPYYHETFECFAEGSALAFEEFGGIARRYRLDNLSPVVTKILSGKNRLTTKRFVEFQQHYGFYQDFCNPAAGNEKGNVESNNRHLKRRLLNKISLNKVLFKDLEAFKVFVWDLCRELNNRDEVRQKFKDEALQGLPARFFESYQTEIVPINKYSLFTFGSWGHYYSAPGHLVGLRVEARIYPSRVDIIWDSSVVSTHKRLYGKKGLVSINVQDIITALCRKPGVFAEWKHRNVLFQQPVWQKFYEKIKVADKDKHYLHCLNLMTRFQEEDLTAAMEIVLNDGLDASSKTLLDLLEARTWNIMEIRPIKTNLAQYDELFCRR